MAEREEALKEMRNELANLKDTNRNQIHLITLIADDYATFADGIVEVICQYIRDLPGDKKLMGIYVMDSILKFAGESQEIYRNLFAKEFVDLFVETFKKVPITIRYNLHKVRITWQPFFPKHRLYQLDLKVKEIDKCWPIFKDNAAAKTLQEQSKQQHNQQQNVQQQKPKIDEKQNNVKVETQQIKNVEKSSEQKNIKLLVKKEAMNKEIEPKNVSLPKSKEENKRNEPVIKNKTEVSKSTKIKIEPSFPNEKKSEENVKPTVVPESSKSNTSLMIQQKTDRSKSPKNDKKLKKRKDEQRSDRRQKSPDRDDKKKRKIDETHIQPTAALGSHAFLPPPAISMNPKLPMVSMPQQKIQPLQPIDTTDSWRRPTIPSAYPPPPLVNMPSVITNETPRLANSGNNRIFVGGRAYEVHYIQNEAVIEQNGLPHRIYFAGPPRDILIDNKPFKLAFDEVKMVNIDGIPHPIRFGAPSRELYIGETPFRGAFGGPPMIANINGRKHEFRLCGAPPEVRIDKDPCYELSIHMGKLRTPQQQQQSNAPPQNKADLQKLLQRIKQTGILDVINKATTSGNTGTNDLKKTQGLSKPSPPIRMEIPKMDSAPQELKDFQINALMVRYKDNVETLHQPRIACTHCGISFPDTNSEPFHRHLDGHIKELLQAKESQQSKYKPFFMSLNDWLNYDELEEVLKINQPETSKNADVETSPDSNQIGSPSDPIANPDLNKYCSVCHEKFHEYYDNEEDEWRFQDCVIRGNNAVHRYCLEQLGDESEIKMETDPMPQQQAFV